MLFTTLRLGIKFLSYIAYPKASYHAINLAYIVEDVVSLCLELFHDMAPFASVKT
jgi:hypothetical protein